MVDARSKAEVRAAALANREGLHIDHRRVRLGVARFLSSLPAGVIVLYDALDGEPDLGPLLEEVPDRRFALTRTPTSGRTLTVHPFAPPYERHRYGYRQPTVSAPVIDDGEVVAVCVPGLAFDRVGGRLGFGAGYYDRFLERLGPDIARIGISDGFIVDRLPVEAHDQPMTHLATEAGVFELPLGAS